MGDRRGEAHTAPPSTDRSRLPRRATALAGLAIFVVGVVGALQPTLILTSVDGRVRGVAGSVDGSANSLYATVGGGDARPVYTEVLDRLGGDSLTGRTIRKERWATTAAVDGRRVSLAPPFEFWRFTTVLAVLVTVGVRRATAAPGGGARSRARGLSPPGRWRRRRG